MPEKKMDPKMDRKTKPAEREAPKPKDDAQAMPEPKANPANPARLQDPDPDDMQTPKNFTPTGDALPMDPMLAPEAQQPGERYEDWLARTGKAAQKPGVYDATVTRGETPS